MTCKRYLHQEKVEKVVMRFLHQEKKVVMYMGFLHQEMYQAEEVMIIFRIRLIRIQMILSQYKIYFNFDDDEDDQDF